MYPEDLKYTAEHEWVKAGEGPVRVGITDFAQDALGDIVYVQLPEVGEDVTPGNAIGEVESTKSVSDVYSPVSGVVAAVNERLADAPGTINADPYGEGWLVEIRVEGGGDPTEALLDAGAYQALVDSA